MPEMPGQQTTVDLLRHAECEGGAIFRGTRDVALASHGWARLQRVTATRGGWQAIISSPMRRCHAFAQALAQQRGLPLVVDERLREMSFGDWEGQPVARVWQQQPQAAWAWFNDPDAHPPPGGERLQALQARVDAAWAQCLQAQRGRHVLMVTHGGVMRALISRALAMPAAHMSRLHTPWACLSRLACTHADGGDMVRLVGHNMAAA